MWQSSLSGAPEIEKVIFKKMKKLVDTVPH
jgi:hypothetical protein